jgi:two-component system response regulator
MPSKQILLVEDSPELHELTCLAWAGGGGRDDDIVWARDGHQALEYLWAQGRHAGRDTREQPALVILDMHLPSLSGLQVLRQLREHPLTEVIPVVMLTSSREPEDLRACYRSGANGYVAKPVAFAQYRRNVACLRDFWLGVNEPAPLSEAVAV